MIFSAAMQCCTTHGVVLCPHETLTFCYCVFFLQLKTQLTQTLSKLETEESERQKVAGDLYKVMIFCFFVEPAVVSQTLVGPGGCKWSSLVLSPGPAVC